MAKTDPDPEVSAVTEWNEVLRDRLVVRGPLSYEVRRGSPFLKLKVGDELHEFAVDYKRSQGPKNRWAKVRIVALTPIGDAGGVHLELQSMTSMESGRTARQMQSCSACNHIWKDHGDGQACSICYCKRFRRGER